MNTDQDSYETDDSDEAFSTSKCPNLSLTNLQLVLQEFSFYEKIALILTSFYPYETYSLNELKQEQHVKKQQTQSSISICSPTLVSSICQLLINICVLLKSEALPSISSSGIVKLLISYIKPNNLLANQSETEDIINMLQQIFTFLKIYYQSTQTEIDKDEQGLVYDLIACVNLNLNSRGFYSCLYDLLGILIATNQETFLIIVFKFWENLAKDLLNELTLEDTEDFVNNSDFESKTNTKLYFFSIYLSRLNQNSLQSKNVQIISENMSYLFDKKEEYKKSQGEELCSKLIKKFDKHFLTSSSTSISSHITSLLKCLFSLSLTARYHALENGLVETLIEHLKYTHSKLNLRSLQSSANNNATCAKLSYDLKETLLILNYLMCSSEDENGDEEERENEIKILVTKYNLHSIIHSFWCWCLQDENLLKSSLLTLCTLTCKNKLAISLMTQSNVISNNPDVCLLNSIIKTVQRSKSSHKLNRECQRYAFALLTNCAQSSECKNIIWKSNLLVDFTSLELNSLNGVLAQSSCDLRLWLRFLLSLSFSHEGQQFFMKVEALLITLINLDELILKQKESSNGQHMIEKKYDVKELHYICLLILRNLAFNASNKSKLISTRNIFIVL